MAGQEINTAHEDMIHDAVFDFQGRYLATCSSDSTVKVFDVKGENTVYLALLNEHRGPVWQVAWSHPKFGLMLASASYDHRCIVWKETSKGAFEKVHEYRGHSSSVNGVSWAPPSVTAQAMLATCSSDTSISILTLTDPTTGTWTSSKIEKAHVIGCNAVSWAPTTADGACRLASGGADCLLKLWKQDKQTGKFLPEATLVPSGKPEYPAWVRDVSFCPNPTTSGTTLLACCAKDEVFLWSNAADSDQWTLLVSMKLDDTVWRVSWHECESMLAVTLANGKVCILKQVSLANQKDWQQVATHSTSGPPAATPQHS